MDNLCFHITDIVTNSIRANASRIRITTYISKENIIIQVKDNGKGMEEDVIQQVTSPFYTTRTTRKVGLGLPFLIQNARQTGGDVCIRSVPDKGTVVEAWFVADHIDCPPWGNLSETIAITITGNPEVDINFIYRSGQELFHISSGELIKILDGIPLCHPKVTQWLTEMILSNIGF